MSPSTIPSRSLILAAAVVFVSACGGSRTVAVSSPAPMAAASTGAFVVRLGADTLAVEQFSRSGNQLVGDVVTRTPTTVVSHYEVTLNGDGMPVRMDYRARRADGTLVPNRPRSVTVLFRGDTVVTQMQMDSVVERRMAAPGAFPLVGQSFALYELPLARMRATGSDTMTTMFLGVGAPRADGYPMRLYGTDSARVWYFGAPMYARVDRGGRLLALDGSPSTNKILVTRVDNIDLAALATHFAALDAAGHGLGPASPRDTVRANVGSAELWVDYGRPSMRGRDLWAYGVLGDTLWRTGANAATQFHTSADLVIGGQTLPAGTYTLWTSARNGTYQLVINSETGQWGTDHDATKDLMRVPLTVSTVARTERFTIGIAPQGNGGLLTLTWGTRQLSVPFTLR